MKKKLASKGYLEIASIARDRFFFDKEKGDKRESSRPKKINTKKGIKIDRRINKGCSLRKSWFRT